MIYKKNLLSYCLWILYTVVAAMGLFALAAYVCLKMGYPAWSGFAASLCLLLAEAFACAFFHALNKRRGIKSREDSDKYRLWLSVAEGLTVTVILGILLTMRIISLSGASRQSALFEEAMVKSGGIIEPSFRISDYLYIRAVNLVCVVFGNKITAVYIFQIVLQLLAFVMIYFAVRRLSGVLPAVCSVLFPGIITNFNSAATDLSPTVMLFFMFALGLLVVSGCFGRSAKGFKLLYCISGVYTGFATGIETALFVLFFIALGVHFVRDGRRKISQVLVSTLMLAVSTAVGFIIYIFLSAWINSADFGAAFSEWSEAVYSGVVSAGQLKYIPFLGYDNVLVLAALCFGIFTFFLNGASYGQGIWTFAAAYLTAVALTCGVAEESAAIGMLYTVLSALAGIAVSNVKPAREILSGENIMQETDDEADSIAVTGTPGRTVTVNLNGESRQVRLLDNPMALPPKREHKPMDYDYEVAEDDDYDIK